MTFFLLLFLPDLDIWVLRTSYKLYLSLSILGITRSKSKALCESIAMHWNPSLAQATLHRKALECCSGIYSIIFIITAKKIHFSPLSVCLEGLLTVFFWPWGRMGSRLFFGFGFGCPSLFWHAEWISQHGTRTSMVWLTTCSRWEDNPRFSIACGCSCSFALLKRLKILTMRPSQFHTWMTTGEW